MAQGGLAEQRTGEDWGKGGPEQQLEVLLVLLVAAPVLVAEAETLRTRRSTHPPCQFSQGQGHQARLTDVPVDCVSVGIGGGPRRGTGWVSASTSNTY